MTAQCGNVPPKFSNGWDRMPKRLCRPFYTYSKSKVLHLSNRWAKCKKNKTSKAWSNSAVLETRLVKAVPRRERMAKVALVDSAAALAGLAGGITQTPRQLHCACRSSKHWGALGRKPRQLFLLLGQR